MLSMEPEDTHPNRGIISYYRRLMELNHIPIVHTLREGNQCADILANIGVQQLDHFVKLDAPSPQLAKNVLADLTGVAFSRNSI